MVQEALHALGLNQKEQTIFLANLSLGSALVQSIARKANVNRTTAYDVLDSLETKGFVSYNLQANKRYYQVIDPDQLLGLMKEKEEIIKSSLPKLRQIKQETNYSPKTEVYVGKNGIKNMLELILKEATHFDSIAGRVELFREFKYYFPKFVKRRVEKNITLRLLIDAPPHDPKAPYKILRNIPNAGMYIYEHENQGRIMLFSFYKEEPIGILIQENQFYLLIQQMFNLIWDNLPDPK